MAESSFVRPLAVVQRPPTGICSCPILYACDDATRLGSILPVTRAWVRFPWGEIFSWLGGQVGNHHYPVRFSQFGIDPRNTISGHGMWWGAIRVLWQREHWYVFCWGRTVFLRRVGSWTDTIMHLCLWTFGWISGTTRHPLQYEFFNGTSIGMLLGGGYGLFCI